MILMMPLVNAKSRGRRLPHGSSAYKMTLAIHESRFLSSKVIGRSSDSNLKQRRWIDVGKLVVLAIS